MNRDVEERIVAMYFDNEDFEKNAKTTIDTLGQLKSGLDLQNSAKGFEVFEKLGKTLNFDKAQKGLAKIKTTVNGMGNILKKVFHLGPIDDAANAVESFYKNYLVKMLGIDLAHTVSNALLSAFKGLTIEPVSAGWTQYESKMDSVKTIMSSTGESIEVVQDHLNDLTQYANKTIYSLTDMTSNLGKFTNNGMKLKDSVQAMKGIANATAQAGQGTQSASMAMYNFSQAMGVGKMTTIDWKSIENANIATQELKNTFIEMAAAQGNIRKEYSKTDKAYHYYYTKNSKGKELKKKSEWTEITAKNFRETLSKDWLDSQVMMHALQIYSGDVISADTLKAWGITDPELIKHFQELGQTALESATQVRTFTKMMDALKEAAQSGWADTFEIIFGNMEEGTNLWTKMNEFFDPILSGSAEARNKLLKDWRETGTQLKVYYDYTGRHAVRNGKGGRDILIETMFEAMNIAKDFAKSVSDAFHSVFGTLSGKDLYNATVRLRDFVSTVKTWLGSADDSESRLGKLVRGLKGFFSIVKVTVNFVKIGFNLLKKLVTPVLDAVLGVLAKLGDFFNGMGDLSPVQVFEKLGDGLKTVWERIKKFFTPQDMYDEKGFKLNSKEIPVVKWLNNIWTNLKNIVKQWGKDSGLTPIFDKISSWWTTIKESFVSGYNSVKTWWDGSGIPAFFRRIWHTITSWFEPQLAGVTYDGTGRHATYTDSPIVAFFKNISTGVDQAFQELKAWWDESGIPDFFKGIWDTVSSWFQPVVITGKQGNTWTENPPIVEFFYTIWHGIEDAFNALSDWWNKDSGIPEFFRGIWDAVSSWFQPVVITGKQGNTWTENPPIVEFFYTIWHGIEDAYNSIKNWWENDSGIPEFFEGMCKQINSWFQPEEVNDQNGQTILTDPPIVRWLKEFWNGADGEGGIVGIWNTITSWSGWASIASFFTDIWGWITEQVSGQSGGTSQKKVKKIGKGKEVSEAASNLKNLREKMQESLKSTKTSEESISFFERILNAMTTLFNSVRDAAKQVAGIPELTKFIESLGTFFHGFLDLITNILSSLGKIMSGEQGLFDDPTIWVTGLIFIVAKIYDFIHTKDLAKLENVESFSQKFMHLAAGLLLLATAVSLLTAIDQSKMWQAVGAIAVIGAVIGVIIGLLNKLSQTRNEGKDDKLTGTQQIINNLVDQLGKVGMIAAAMALLPSIIETIGKVKKDLDGADIGGDILKTLLGLAAVIATTSIVFAAVQKITKDNGLDIKATAKTAAALVVGMSILIVGFEAIVGLIGGISDAIGGQGNTDKVVDVLNQGAEIMAAVGGAIGGFFAALFGGGTSEQKAKQAINTLDTISDAAKIFDNEKVSGISRMMSMIKNLTSQAEFIDDKKLDGFASSMSKLGAGIFEYVRFLNDEQYFGSFRDLSDPTSDIYNRMMAFHDLGINMGEMLKVYDELSSDSALRTIENIAEKNNLEKLVSNLNAILSGLGDLKNPNSGIQFDGLTIATKLVKAIQIGLLDPSLPKFDATTIVDDILEAINLGSSSIALAVHNMVQQGLLGSSTDESGNGYQASEEEGLPGVMKFLEQFDSGNFKFDFSGIESQFLGDDGIISTLTGLTDQIPSAESIFSDKGWLDFKDSDGNPIDIVGSLQEQITSLSGSLNESDPIKVTITPVFDTTELTAEKLQAAVRSNLGVDPLGLGLSFNNPAQPIDYAKLKTDLGLGDIQMKLDSILSAIWLAGTSNVNAIGGLGSNMDGIATSISNMRLVLDTGVLVGQITPMVDLALGQRANLYGRTGVVFDS